MERREARRARTRCEGVRREACVVWEGCVIRGDDCVRRGEVMRKGGPTSAGYRRCERVVRGVRDCKWDFVCGRRAEGVGVRVEWRLSCGEVRERGGGWSRTIGVGSGVETGSRVRERRTVGVGWECLGGVARRNRALVGELAWVEGRQSVSDAGVDYEIDKVLRGWGAWRCGLERRSQCERGWRSGRRERIICVGRVWRNVAPQKMGVRSAGGCGVGSVGGARLCDRQLCRYRVLICFPK
ncbi:hypothetical protein Tco_0295411 [Tanacetum coccineum]